MSVRGCAACLSLLVSTLGAAQDDAVLKRQAVNPDYLREPSLSVLENGLAGAPSSSSAFSGQPLGKLAPKARVELLRAALAVTKAYLSTDAAADAWAERTLGDKPKHPKDELERQEKDFERGLKEAEEALALAPPESRAEVKKSLAEQRKASQAMFAEQRKQLPAAVKQHEQELKAWNARKGNARGELKGKLKAVLQEFLSGTEALPYDAKLVPMNDGSGKKAFADATLEAKPMWWKACFRAGKEPVDEARRLAKQWLTELR